VRHQWVASGRSSIGYRIMRDKRQSNARPITSDVLGLGKPDQAAEIAPTDKEEITNRDWRFIFRGEGAERSSTESSSRGNARFRIRELIGGINRSRDISRSLGKGARARARDTVTRSELPRVPRIYDDGGVDTCDRLGPRVKIGTSGRS